MPLDHGLVELLIRSQQKSSMNLLANRIGLERSDDLFCSNYLSWFGFRRTNLQLFGHARHLLLLPLVKASQDLFTV